MNAQTFNHSRNATAMESSKVTKEGKNWENDLDVVVKHQHCLFNVACGAIKRFLQFIQSSKTTEYLFSHCLHSLNNALKQCRLLIRLDLGPREGKIHSKIQFGHLKIASGGAAFISPFVMQLTD